jgi:hypothetical protein
MKSLILLSFLVLVSFVTIAQNKFEKGYFISSSGDKIECYIKNAGWKNNPTQIEFKLDLNSKGNIATSNDIKEFGFINGTVYVKATVQIDRSPSGLSNLTVDRAPKFNEETLFLKQLINGYAKLYLYEDKDLVRFFYQHGEIPITQLVYKAYLIDSRIAYNYQYKQQLSLDFKNTDVDYNEFENCLYTSRSLSNLFRLINRAYSDDDNQSLDKIQRDEYNFTIRPGLVFPIVKFEDERSVYRDVAYKVNATFRLGAELAYLVPSYNNKLELLAEPTFVLIDLEKTYPSTQIAGGEVTARFKYSAIDFNLGARYNFFLSDKSKISLLAQYCIDVRFTNVQSYSRLNVSFNELELKSFGNFVGGVGYKYGDRMSVEVRYGFNRNVVSDYNGISNKFQTLSLVLGYSIF